MNKARLPVGAEDFEMLRQEDLYYVDKTGLIKELLDNFSLVTLFTRPRRFGKSLNMSMLRYFFEIGTDKSIFDGLAISKEEELCKKYMGQYPVIFLSLKEVEGKDYETARTGMWSVISDLANNFDFLGKSDRVTDAEKRQLFALQYQEGNLEGSLKILSRLLYKYYKKKVIILIDEYDVPLDKAYQRGYYDQMALLIRQIFQGALKTNDALQYAILTGCLRVSRESIFTGLNNLSVHTIADEMYDEWFGFNDTEVIAMLEYYGLSEYYEQTKEWYDGYRFGQRDVYCPWDVINWCVYLLNTKNIRPQNFWANTSSNDLILMFAQKADLDTRQQIGELIDGKSIFKKIQLDLTYPEIATNIDNLWSVLFTTGYLTQRGQDKYGNFELVIPNREIRAIFVEKIDKWFEDKVLSDISGLRELISAFLEEDEIAIEECLNDSLDDLISYLDGGKNFELKESFYHGLLLGMLRSNSNWHVKSNREAGRGRADIIVFPQRRDKNCSAFIIEVKYTNEYKMLEKKAKEALKQIELRQYDKYFGRSKPKKIVHYGIAFFGKDCCVVKK